MNPSRWLLGIGTLVSLAAIPLHAQRGTARIYGTVIDLRTHAPIANVQIVHMGDGRSVTSDSLGLYQFDRLASGLVKFMVRAPRYPATTFVVALAPGEQMERDVELEVVAASSGVVQALPEVKIDAPVPLGSRFADFEHRRLTGRGQYMTGEEIQKTGAGRLQELMRAFRGVQVECGGGAGCFIRMSRAPMRCLPEYIVDERVDNVFGPSVPAPDIQALEVYTGPADVPGEFAGRNAGCGLVVIWTKSGPPRAKRPAPQKPDSTATGKPESPAGST
ncbi:MAG: carboxypeptidase-like regulatory domain-containing protein [Gemmatimonadota bacterium]